MQKSTPFRTCILILLILQAAIWALTLLDLVSPGKPLSLFRTSLKVYRHSTDILAQLLSRRAQSMLHYSNIRGRS
ncbi:hypothetical protein M011DRAFT_467069 [Sporormia fimetaria CBS 119925]|uniref:Uncharacterized protein n=1 Tax=Sporormia fimetaria CBS 119925 TaxID=1340428 RepID=A0A6A6VFR2_9PLEO|nr:hypothetical protein M011DRAFT_467069 [Sporormia fimetaria CBS 119925]